MLNRLLNVAVQCPNILESLTRSNLLCSPYSLHMALAVLMEGVTRGSRLEAELVALLHKVDKDGSAATTTPPVLDLITNKHDTDGPKVLCANSV